MPLHETSSMIEPTWIKLFHHQHLTLAFQLTSCKSYSNDLSLKSVRKRMRSSHSWESNKDIKSFTSLLFLRVTTNITRQSGFISHKSLSFNKQQDVGLSDQGIQRKF